MKIYNGFLYFNEIHELMSIRFHELHDVVDFFIVVESEESFSGIKKPLYFKKMMDTFFHQWRNKIRYIVIPSLEKYIQGNDRRSRWSKQWLTYDFIHQGMYDAEGSDWLFVSDADEIISRESLIQAVQQDRPVACKLPYHYYYLNVKDRNNVLFNTICGTRVKNIRKVSEIRRFINKSYKILYNSGWHFSYLGSEDIILEKVQSIPSGRSVTGSVTVKKNNLEDLFERREYSWEKTLLDSSYPRYIIENQEQLSHLIYT